MKFEIKSRFSGSVLFAIETESMKLAVELAVKSKANLRYANLRSADLSYANLSYANLSYADLRSADLSHANLRSADLSYANLRSADLSYANLSYANLSSADLSSAKNINKFLTTPLYILLDQPGKIRAYKLVKENGSGPFFSGIVYQQGKSYSVIDADANENKQCSSGIHLATLDWCMNEWKPTHRILIAEFTKEDIAAIPIGSDGKFRVHRCKIVGEKNLKEIGLVK